MTMEHIQLTTFQTMSNSEFDQTVLNSAIEEMNQNIKDNMNEFRLTFELSDDSLAYKLYKNAITGYYINKGFKIVNYSGFIYIVHYIVYTNIVKTVFSFQIKFHTTNQYIKQELYIK